MCEWENVQMKGCFIGISPSAHFHIRTFAHLLYSSKHLVGYFLTRHASYAVVKA